MTREELRQQCLTDKLALSRLLGYYFQPDVHTDLFANYLRLDNSKPLFEQDVIKRRLVLWSRGFYKTTSIVVEAVQLILNFPDISIMLLEATLPKSKEVLLEIKGHFTGKNVNSKLNTLFPEFCAEKMGSSVSFTVPARKRSRISPTVFIASPKSNKAGWHPDAAFFDDLVTEQNYRNPLVMKQVIQEFSHYEPLVNPGGYFYVTGTRYTFADLYEHIIRENETEKAATGKNKWQITVKGCWPVDENGNRVGESYFPPRMIGDVRIGISTEELLEKQRANPETFAAQYLNQPIAAGTQLFTQQLLLGAVKAKDPSLPVGPAVLFVDLGAATHARADKSVILCGRTVGGRPCCTDLRSGQWAPLQVANNILEMALLHRPLKVLIEGTAAGTYFIDYLKVIARDKGIQLNIEPIKVSNNKDAKNLRIAAVEGAIKTGRLTFLAGLPGWAELVQQFTQFPKGAHDDEIDTVSLMVQFFANQTANFDPIPQPRLPFFLLQPGRDYGLEQQIIRPNADNDFYPIPEPIF